MASTEALSAAAASALAVSRSSAAIAQASGFIEIDWRGRPVQIEHQWLGDPGAGRPLIVFLHEGLGSVTMWRDFPQRLCAAVGCRGLVYSRPGYGRSSPRAADEAWGTDFLHRQALEVLPALLTALGVDTAKNKPWLFGHSDGGSIALLYAAYRPDEIAGAVLLAPHIRVEDVSISSIQQARLAYQDTDLQHHLPAAGGPGHRRRIRHPGADRRHRQPRAGYRIARFRRLWPFATPRSGRCGDP